MYRLLIVEDEYILREGIAQLIDYQRLGIHEVIAVENGEIAWELFQTKPFDIVLTDINMPRLDGIALAQEIKRLEPHTHVVFLTGYDYFDYAVSALKLGADDYLLKPISRKEIEAVLMKVLKRLKQREQQTLLMSQQSSVTSAKNPLIDYIEQQLSSPNLSLKDTATALGYSPNYFSTLVKKELGMSFQDYVSQQRIARAKILLLTTNDKIYQIAEQVGFDDMNYFSSKFKLLTGMTPSTFRKGGNK